MRHWDVRCAPSLVVQFGKPPGYVRDQRNVGYTHAVCLASRNGCEAPRHLWPLRYGQRDREETRSEHTSARRVHVEPPQGSQLLNGMDARIADRLTLGSSESGVRVGDRPVQPAGQRFEDQRAPFLVRYVSLEPRVNGLRRLRRRGAVLRTDAVDRLGELAQCPPRLAEQPLKLLVRHPVGHAPPLHAHRAFDAFGNCPATFTVPLSVADWLPRGRTGPRVATRPGEAPKLGDTVLAATAAQNAAGWPSAGR